MKNISAFLYFILVMLTCDGCYHAVNDYKQAVRDGMKTVPHVQEIMKMFPGAKTDNFFSDCGKYSDVTGKQVTWNTSVYFGGKYVFTYQIDAMLDYKKNKFIKVVTKPKFVLWQVSEIYNATPETIGASFNGDHKFGEEDWNKVVAANGDFSVIGIKLDTNSPVSRFDEYVHECMKSRIEVQP